MTDQERSVTPLEAQRLDPERATSERAGETPPHEDAERLESALREGGPLPDRDDGDAGAAAREAPLDPGGTSLP
ncbi:MAG: hypothetical protein ACJ74O_06690 [Frankiaceae bacterium]